MEIGNISGAVLLAVVLTATLPGCDKQEGPMEQAGKSVDKAAEKVGEKVEKAGENIQDSARGEKK